MGQMIFLTQYSDRMPYGPTSRLLIISVVVISVSEVSVRVVPPPGGALAAMSSHLKLAHSNRNIRLTPAKDFTV